jgi:DNA-binding transcriptional MerR regulator
MPEYVSIQDAVKREGVSRSAITRYRKRGLLKAYRAEGVDRRVYIDLEQLRELRRNPPMTPID